MSKLVESVPVGSVLAYAGVTPPEGWLLCEGQSLLRSLYPALFEAIGVAFGSLTAITFSLPDLRGVFVKGAGTTARAAGKDASGNFYAGVRGTYLTDKMQGHKHSTIGEIANTTAAGVHSYCSEAGGGIPDATNIITDPKADATNGVPRTGHTTEPQSLGLNYIIKTESEPDIDG